MAKFTTVVLVDAKRPIAPFAYLGGKSELIDTDHAHIWELNPPGDAVPLILEMLAAELGAVGVLPGRNCDGVFCTDVELPARPTGALDADRLCACVTLSQGEEDVVVDEAITTGKSYWDMAARAPRHTYIGLTGGAIGSGPNLAVGAALACPGRRVIDFQVTGMSLLGCERDA